ncbi:MAG: hypothetical protein JNN15_11125 [Blastocatellia bacterium]|nr:hypothetical protein [Blastocatellia bacterium]
MELLKVLYRKLKVGFKERKQQHGLALIVIVLFLWIVAAIGIVNILLFTGRALSDTNVEVALVWAENEAISTTGIVREKIDQETYKRIREGLQNHLAKAIEAKNTRTSYMCQENISPDSPIYEHYQLCDPVSLLDRLPGAEKQKIDDLKVLKPDNPELLSSGDWKEILHETNNDYNYKLSATFINQELIQAAVPRGVSGTIGLPRIERYRWLVKADIETRTYLDIEYHLVAYWNVITTVYVYDKDNNFTLDCLGFNNSIPRGFGRRPTLLICKDRSKQPGSLDCIETEPCGFDTECFKQLCKETPDCEERVEEDLGICKRYPVALCSVLNNKLFAFDPPGTAISDTLYNSQGCESNKDVSYVWTTVIRVVDVSHNHD